MPLTESDKKIAGCAAIAGTSVTNAALYGAMAGCGVAPSGAQSSEALLQSPLQRAPGLQQQQRATSTKPSRSDARHGRDV
eukprot:3426828-Lingulodinium_polyedra.AAC.1